MRQSLARLAGTGATAGLLLISSAILAPPHAHAQPDTGLAASPAATFRNLVERAENATDGEEKIGAIESALRLEPVLTEWPLPTPRAETRAKLLRALGDAYRTRLKGERANNLEQGIKAYESALTVYTRETFPHDWALTQSGLAVAYWTRARGEPGDDGEQAIKAFESALSGDLRETNPQSWARAQLGLGSAYATRTRGERGDNREKAISAFEAALTVYTRDAAAQNWALAQSGLAVAYANRGRGDRADNIEQAIKAYEAALGIYARETSPQYWAGMQSGLAQAYSDRIRGDRADNIEQAIKAYEAALSVSTREESPQDWARIQSGLALAYSKRIRGDRADNVEQSIKAYEAAATVRTREAFPQDWARTQTALGLVYLVRGRGERADNVDEAIKDFTAALTVNTRERSPQGFALTQSALGLAYVSRIRGELGDNIEQAIKASQAALTVYTREASPQDWARVQSSLAGAYAARSHGVRADNIEEVIKALEAARTVWTREAFPQDWAATQTYLGGAYRDRIRGDRADNIEQAISLYEAALTIRTRETSPQDWAWTQLNLANAYSTRIRGNRADNVERAIKGNEAALSVYTRATFPQDWAAAQNSIAAAYWRRVQGDRADNMEQAIKALEAALTVYTREASPREWALAQQNLAVGYRDRIRGERADNVELAIKAFEAALAVRSRASVPQDWAWTQNQLALTYVARTRGERAENIEQAIAIYQDALAVRTREAFPQEWAETEVNLANAYRERIRGQYADNIARAVEGYQSALAVYTREAYPRDHLRTGRLLAQALLQRRDWHAARLAYADARDAFLLLFGQGLDEAEARSLIEDAGPLFAEAAYVAAEQGDAEAALGLLSESRARLMAVALQQQTFDLPPGKRVRHEALKLEIAEWSRIAETSTGIDGANALNELGKLRRELEDLLKEAFAQNAPAGGAMAFARALLPDGGAIVAPIITGIGSKLMIVTAGKDGPLASTLDLPELTTGRIDQLMRGDGKKNSGWTGAYQLQGRDARQWLSAIERIGPDLWTLLAGRLDAALRERGVKPGSRLVFLPTGALGLLPLGLARDPVNGRRFVDSYEIAYAPSLEALSSASRWLRPLPVASLAAAVNPTGDIPGLNLPFTEIEGALVATHFAGKSLVRLDKHNATPEVVLAGLKGKSYWHFASHGFFDWSNARRAGLLMKDRAPLTVGALLDAEASLGHPRLVVLSACETGLYETERNPDEFVGLPAAFMQIGAVGVLAALWQVDDLATALLMARFYELHIDHGLSPAAALRQAQSWLRGATDTELIAYGKAAAARAHLDPVLQTSLAQALKTVRRSEDTRAATIWNVLRARALASATTGTGNPKDKAAAPRHPFDHPYYWGAFVYTGL
jgi:CHAT domain-containing protein